jgi:hypothetical protein
MVKKRTPTTPESHARRKKQGRGEGVGAESNPYLHVQDVSSLGRKSRVWALDRICHVLSDLELSFLLILLMMKHLENVKDVREQNDLPLDRTVEIAKRLQLDHPVDPKTLNYHPITVDFLIITDDGRAEKTWARTVKPSEKLSDRRVLEKLEIERVFFEGNNIDWGIVTEHQLPKQLRINTEHLRPYLTLDNHNIDLNEEMVWESVEFLTPMIHAGMRLQELARSWEAEYRCEIGIGITAIKYLVVNGAWFVNLNQPIVPEKPIPIMKSLPRLAPQSDNEGG